MENDNKEDSLNKNNQIVIFIDTRYYWDLNLIPVKNEFDEYCNRCALVDSETKQELDAVMFDSEWLIPIIQTKSKIGGKELALQLKTITDKHGIVVKRSAEMPKDKKAQEVKHIGKKRF